MNEILNLLLILVFLGACGVLVNKRSLLPNSIQISLAIVPLLEKSTDITPEQRTWSEFCLDVGQYAYDHKGFIMSSTIIVLLIILASRGQPTTDFGSGSKLSSTGSNLPLPSTGGDLPFSAGADLAFQAVEVILQPEVPRALFTVVGSATGLALAWATGVWSAEIIPFSDLTAVQQGVLQQLAEELVRNNPRILDELFGDYSPENFEGGLKKLGEISGILDASTSGNSKKIARITALLLAEPTTSFADIVEALNKTTNTQTKFKVLLLFHLTTIIIGLLDGNSN